MVSFTITASDPSVPLIIFYKDGRIEPTTSVAFAEALSKLAPDQQMSVWLELIKIVMKRQLNAEVMS